MSAGTGDKMYVDSGFMKDMKHLLKAISDNTQTTARIAEEQTPPPNPLLMAYKAVSRQIDDALQDTKLLDGKMNPMDSVRLQRLLIERDDLLQAIDKARGGGVIPEESQNVNKGWFLKQMQKYGQLTQPPKTVAATTTSPLRRTVKKESDFSHYQKMSELPWSPLLSKKAIKKKKEKYKQHMKPSMMTRSQTQKKNA